MFDSCVTMILNNGSEAQRFLHRHLLTCVLAMEATNDDVRTDELKNSDLKSLLSKS